MLQTAILQDRSRVSQLLLDSGAVLNPERTTYDHSIQPNVVRRDKIISPEANFEGDKRTSLKLVSEEDTDLCATADPDNPNELNRVHTAPEVTACRKLNNLRAVIMHCSRV